MTKQKLDQEIQKKLFSANQEQTLSALNTLKTEGNKLYLPMLFDLLLSNPEEEVKKEIIKILGTIKMKDTVPVFTDALEQDKYKPIRNIILSACWQNGLDFKNYMPLLIKLIVEEDWQTGFEAFTIIENMKNLPEKKIIDESIKIIEGALKKTDEKKSYFLQEILMIIR
jgi:hypothetical protein